MMSLYLSPSLCACFLKIMFFFCQLILLFLLFRKVGFQFTREFYKFCLPVCLVMIICFGIHKRESEVCFIIMFCVLEYFSPFITAITFYTLHINSIFKI